MTSRDASTWLRVVFYEVEAGKGAEAIDYLRASTHDALRLLQEQAGFRVGYWGHDPVVGTMAAVTYWGGLDYIERASGRLEQIHAQRGEHGGVVSDVLNLQLWPTQTLPQGTTGWLPKTFGPAEEPDEAIGTR